MKLCDVYIITVNSTGLITHKYFATNHTLQGANEAKVYLVALVTYLNARGGRWSLAFVCMFLVIWLMAMVH